MPDAVDPALVEITSDVVSAYLAKNHVPPAEIPTLIASVHATFADLGREPEPIAEPERPTPAVPIKKSVGEDFIVCLEDGRKFKSLKRHLATAYGMSPEQYRAKWNLPRDYPMVAPAYSNARSALAKSMGLGAIRWKR